MHDVPLIQLFALTACSAYAQGMEPDNGAYEERELEREMAVIQDRDRLTTTKGGTWQA